MLKIEVDKASLYTVPCHGCLSQFPPAVSLSYHCASKESRYRSYDTITPGGLRKFCHRAGVLLLSSSGDVNSFPPILLLHSNYVLRDLPECGCEC